MNIVMLSEKGSSRNKNEDKCYCKNLSNNISWSIICDGMGGAKGGYTASSLAVETVMKEMENFSLAKKESEGDVKKFVIKALKKANFVIYERAKQDKNLEGMGTTTVFVVILDDEAYIFHVGDSRAYLISNENIEQITVDHSFVQEMLIAGRIKEEELKTHPQKNLITRSLGVEKEIKIDYKKVSFNERDALLLLTDGITNHVEKNEILNIFKNSQNLNSFANDIAKTAKNLGNSDDLTVVVMQK